MVDDYRFAVIIASNGRSGKHEKLWITEGDMKIVRC